MLQPDWLKFGAGHFYFMLELGSSERKHTLWQHLKTTPDRCKRFPVTGKKHTKDGPASSRQRSFPTKAACLMTTITWLILQLAPAFRRNNPSMGNFKQQLRSVAKEMRIRLETPRKSSPRPFRCHLCRTPQGFSLNELYQHRKHVHAINEGQAL